MKLTFDVPPHRQIAVVTLSKRNLLSLLHKLEMPGSARELTTNDCPEGWLLSVRCETDEEHYDERPDPPGAMHPDTEQFLAEHDPQQ